MDGNNRCQFFTQKWAHQLRPGLVLERFTRSGGTRTGNFIAGLVDVTHNTDYTLSAYQTPALTKVPKVPKVAKESTVNTEDKVAQDTDKKTKAKGRPRKFADKVRFFVFRDAKQYTGLCDCQATYEAKLNFHFNASLAALNLLRLEDRQQAVEGTGRNVISIASWKTRKFNALQPYVTMALSPRKLSEVLVYEHLKNQYYGGGMSVYGHY